MHDRTKLAGLVSLHLAVYAAGLDGHDAVAVALGAGSAVVLAGAVIYELSAAD